MEKEISFYQDKKEKRNRLDFKFFKKWLKSFKPVTASVKKVLTQQERDLVLLSKTYDSLLKENDWESLSQMNKAGYIPNKTQEIELSKLIKNYFLSIKTFQFKYEKANQFNQLIEQKLYIPEEVKYWVYSILTMNETSNKYLMKMNSDYSQELAQEIKKVTDFKNLHKLNNQKSDFVRRFLKTGNDGENLDIDTLALFLPYIEKWLNEDKNFYANMWSHSCSVGYYYLIKDNSYFRSGELAVKLINKIYSEKLLPSWKVLTKEFQIKSINTFNIYYKKIEEDLKIKYKDKDKEYSQKLAYESFQKLEKLFLQLNAQTITHNDIEVNPIGFNDILKKTQELFAHTISEHLTLSEKDFPQEVIEVLNKIKQAQNYLEDNNSYLDTIQKLWIENMLQRRIPQIIKLYNSFNQEDKNNLKTSNDQNPTELCINSFENILSEMEDLLKKVKEKQLDALKVANQYTKQFKK